MDGRSRLEQAQSDVEEVKVIMLDNLNKADERSGKLEELDDRANHLHEMSGVFLKTTTKVKNQKRWENQKMKLIMAAVAVIVVAAIIGIVVYSLSGSPATEEQRTGNDPGSTPVPGSN